MVFHLFFASLFFMIESHNTFCDYDCEREVFKYSQYFKSKKNKTNLSDNDLLSIVIPEIITYSKKKDRFEKYLVLVFYYSKRSHFKHISVGPFQMQIDFMLRNSSETNYEVLITNLDEFTQIDKQYEILNNYVLNNPNLSLKELITKYNSGKKNGDFIFTKIKSNKSYYEISKDLISIINI